VDTQSSALDDLACPETENFELIKSGEEETLEFIK